MVKAITADLIHDKTNRMQGRVRKSEAFQGRERMRPRRCLPALAATAAARQTLFIELILKAHKLKFRRQRARQHRAR